MTDAVAAHATRAANATRIAFGLSTDTRRLELTIGPFRPGASTELERGASDEVESALRLLSDELDVRHDGGTEVLRIVMLDHSSQAPRPG